MAVSPPYHPTPKATATQMPVDYEADDLEEHEAADEDEFYTDEEEEEPHYWLHGSTAAKFLLAGGVAGGGMIPRAYRPGLLSDLYDAVSRTCTAPFDRLKIFLITRPPDLGGTSLSPQAPVRGFKSIASAVQRIYAEGGVRAFWTGNGLSVAKILPESAIKFFAYESSVSISFMLATRDPSNVFPLFPRSSLFLWTHRNGSLHDTGTMWMIPETSAGSAGSCLAA